jgi:hypothetical protein
MSAIDSLRYTVAAAARIAELEAEVARLGAKVSALDGLLGTALAERDSLCKQLATLTARAEATRNDTARFEYLCRNMPGRASRILLGEMSWTGDMDEWRKRIDAALVAAPPSRSHGGDDLTTHYHGDKS